MSTGEIATKMRVAGEMLITGYLNSCAMSWIEILSRERIVRPEGATISKFHVSDCTIPGVASFTSLNKAGDE
jgi:hypothetical protein